MIVKDMDFKIKDKTSKEARFYFFFIFYLRTKENHTIKEAQYFCFEVRINA